MAEGSGNIETQASVDSDSHISFNPHGIPANILLLLGRYYFTFSSSSYLSFWSCRGHPTPQPQQCQTWATSMTDTAAHRDAGTLTHWAGPGIGPTSSRIIAGFITTEPQQECWDLICNLTPVFPHWFFCLDNVSIVKALKYYCKATEQNNKRNSYLSLPTCIF